MALTWTLAELTTRFRKLTGLTSTVDMSDADVGNLINDYYVNHFPTDATIDEFDTFLTQALSATDSGEYTIASEVDRLDDPVTINGEIIELIRDREEFFQRFPNEEQFITTPTLAIGTSSTAAVKNSAFTYRIGNYSYSASAGETAFSGLDTVPQNKYGAFSLKIDSDGDITIAQASGNSDGYDTPRLALEGLSQADGSSCYMGYVTVISTDSGGFIPGTTVLSDSAVTDTYTDGQFGLRAQPEAVLLYGTKLYTRPKANDIYECKALHIGDRPTALSGATTIADPKHGPMIATGAAILYLNSIGDMAKVTELGAGTMDYYMRRNRQDKTKKMLGRVVKRSF